MAVTYYLAWTTVDNDLRRNLRNLSALRPYREKIRRKDLAWKCHLITVDFCVRYFSEPFIAAEMDTSFHWIKLISEINFVLLLLVIIELNIADGNSGMYIRS